MRAIGVLALLLVAAPAFAWNATGHRVIAAIAYERLTPKARARVDDLLKQHPDYAALTHDGTDGRAVFIAAAVWPDDIKSDPRFYDEMSKADRPTLLLPGYPDMGRHTMWHYYNAPYTPDHAHAVKPGLPNALIELDRLIREMDNPKPYDLPWLEHILGDVHEPLHCVDRLLRSEPQADAGGNRVFVTPGRNLHAFWDSLAGSNTTDVYVTKLATDLASDHPAPAQLDQNPRTWLDEGFRLATHEVYTFGLETGSSQNLIQLTEKYQENAKRVVYARIALAGYRLAAVLNYRLR